MNNSLTDLTLACLYDPDFGMPFRTSDCDQYMCLPHGSQTPRAIQDDRPHQDAVRDRGTGEPIRCDQALTVFVQMEFNVAQCWQASESKSPGSVGTRGAHRASSKAQARSVMADCEDESPDKCQESARLGQHCRPVVQDVVRHKGKVDNPWIGSRLAFKRQCDLPVPRVRLTKHCESHREAVSACSHRLSQIQLEEAQERPVPASKAHLGPAPAPAARARASPAPAPAARARASPAPAPAARARASPAPVPRAKPPSRR
ncbi:uncharacterized protein LOC143490243 [Brachyhypopomus gauderio]|uniref:uncharacterized protein LOC143490243 n=1 Tax=Brachyhypopomus gauderio TaxID=698409 RepID=UPI004041D5AA